jgi:hypothetical protein
LGHEFKVVLGELNAGGTGIEVVGADPRGEEKQD